MATANSASVPIASNTQIIASGALGIGAPPSQLPTGYALPTEIGGSLSLKGTSIEDDGVIVAPSGIVNLTATNGNIHLADSASINVSGTTIAVADQFSASPGGMVTLTANSPGAGIVLDSGSSISVAGSGSAPAGSLSITASGAVDLSGKLNGQAATSDGTGGSFALNAGSLANDLTPLASNLTGGGFTNAINVEVGSGNLDLASGGVLNANSIVLSADQGVVDIAGTLTANSGAQRGFIGLYGGTGVILEASGQLHADGSGDSGRGGEIDISSTCANCTVQLFAGSQISASGQGQMGELVLQAPFLQGSSSVAISTPNSSTGLLPIVGSSVGQVIIEPTTTFTETNASSVNSDIANVISTAEGNVSGASNSILATLAPSGGPLYSVQTGVIVQDLSAADTLNLTGIDLYQYSSQGSVVDLTVRAAGAVNISGKISDGYTGSGSQTAAAYTQSGSLTFVAGANTNSANPLATLATSSAQLTLGSSSIVRTGTGDINIAAAGNLNFLSNASVYTSGVEDANVSPLPAKTDLISFTSGGGNVHIQSGGSILAQAVSGDSTNYSVTGWQVHEGNSGSQQAPLFGIYVAGFDWNVGALGGGDVTVTASDGITKLSAATADSMPLGSAAIGTGGGLSMTTGGDIGSVQVYVASGTGTLMAGGGLTAPLTYTTPSEAIDQVGSSFALSGNSSISVWARNSVQVDAVYNPTSFQQAASGVLAGYYFSYGDNSGLSLESTTGNVDLELDPGNEMLALLGKTGLALNRNVSSILPANLSLMALQGDVDLNLALTTVLYPSSTGQLTVLAGRDINGPPNGSDALIMADVLASTIPDLANLAAGSSVTALPTWTKFSGDNHAGDLTPAVVAAGRDINGLSLRLPEAAQIVAGRDIVDLTYVGQNANASDITLVSAGRDIITPVALNGDVIEIGGQGSLDVFAGRNIYLGFSYGIVTTGDLQNVNLPSASGADITVMAGLGSPQNADDADFLQKIVAPSSTYQSDLVSYVETVNGQSGLTFAQAEADLKGFSQPQQTAFVDQVFFNELLLSGREANAGTGVGFTRGYAAIDALFPNSRTDETETTTGSYTGPYSGDLNMIYSEIYTQSGGNINILTPGGQINVGLAVPPAIVQTPKPASQLGIVAEGAGDVNIYSLGSVNVDAARIFTLGGGNILIWSDLGNIDAGNGSKASLSIPPPSISYDAQGDVIFNYTGAVAGSGIRTIQTNPDQAAGSVDLDAPVGTVDAGDAGIGAAGNINIAAQHVIGASNINFGGTATGVPPAVSSIGASLSSATAAASSTSTNAESKSEETVGSKTDTAPLSQAALSWLDVTVTGIGEENCKPEDTACLSRQKQTQ
jgi:filamentous hemagglutinin